MEKMLKGAVAKRDYLTQVFERSVLEDVARRYIADKSPFSFLLIDVDNFKNVNDTYGHAVGDKVIVAVAEKLKECIGQSGIIGRFGGDEFIILVPDVVDYDDVWHFSHNIFKSLDNFIVPDCPKHVITITLGLSRFPKDGVYYDILFEKADKALYRGKTKGRGCFIIYLDEKHRDIKLLSKLEHSFNSVQLHNQIFNTLTKDMNLATAIPKLLSVLSKNLMIDHIGIQGKEKLKFSEIYPIARTKDFAFIDNSLILPNVDESTGTFYINEIYREKDLRYKELVDEANNQKIGSFFFARIDFGDEFYGFLRADNCSTCIWQNGKMDLLVTAAKAIGMILHMQKQEIDKLK